MMLTDDQLRELGAATRLADLRREQAALVKHFPHLKALGQPVRRRKHKARKMHWTQLPENRRKMSLAQKKLWRERKAKKAMAPGRASRDR